MIVALSVPSLSALSSIAVAVAIDSANTIGSHTTISVCREHASLFIDSEIVEVEQIARAGGTAVPWYKPHRVARDRLALHWPLPNSRRRRK
jgi:hypothetical protein